MVGLKYLKLILLNFLLFYNAEAQRVETKSENEEADQLYIHHDKPFYTNGETIWYKVYIINNGSDQILSKVIYIDFIDPAGKVLVQQKLKVNGRTANGDIELPVDIEEGNYFLKAYTQWNKNFNSLNNYLIKLPIYSEWKTQPAQNTQEKVETPSFFDVEINNKSNLISIVPDKKSYSRNEKVTLHIQTTDKAGTPVRANLSLAVTENALLPLINNSGIHIRKEALNEQLQESRFDTLKYSKEQTLNIKGTVIDPATGEPFNTRFLSIYTPGISEFKSYEITDGNLDHKLPDFYGSQIIQFHNFDPYQKTIPQVKIEKVDEYSDIEATSKDLPVRNITVEKYLEAARMRRKINEVFEIDHQEKFDQPYSGVSEFKADKTFLMKDFQSLKDVEEFISTFFFKTRIIEKEGKKSVLLYNYDSKYNFMESPWYLLDGYLTRDEAFILKIPLKNVEKLEIFYRTKTLSGQFDALMIRSGVLAIHTKEKGLLMPKLDPKNNIEVIGFYNSRHFKVPEIKDLNKKKPDFRPLIYWNPNIVTDDNGKATISFPASSAIGVFNINVEGILPNGAVISGIDKFMVSEESP